MTRSCLSRAQEVVEEALGIDRLPAAAALGDVGHVRDAGQLRDLRQRDVRDRGRRGLVRATAAAQEALERLLEVGLPGRVLALALLLARPALALRLRLRLAAARRRRGAGVVDARVRR